MIANILSGFAAVSSIEVIFALIAGVAGGMVIGALPGFSAAMGVSLLIPITYSMSPVAALSMLVALYTSAIYGGSITAILCHTPGTPASAATAIDGYKLTQQGRGMEAMGVATFASGFGGVISAIVMLFLAPALGKFSLKFSVLEYFLLSVFGLTVIASLAGDSLLKGLFSGILGLLLGCVGLDGLSGVPRMTLGSINLEDGINFVPALIGLFSVSQVMIIAYDVHHGKDGSVIEVESGLNERRLPPLKEMKTLFPTMIRSSIIGSVVGIIPAAGASISSWICYSTAKKFSKKPELFGNGAFEGIAASETGNNAATGGALIPLITLGLPGSSVAAILLGGMMIHGLVPGSTMFNAEHSSTTYGIMVAFLIANFLMAVFGIFAAKYVAKVSLIPMGYLGPVIVALSVLGTFAIRNNLFDVLVMFVFGLIGFFLKKAGFATAPLILGMVLSNICENNWRRAVLLATAKGGMAKYILGRPIAIVLILLIAVSVFSPIVMAKVNKKAKA